MRVDTINLRGVLEGNHLPVEAVYCAIFCHALNVKFGKLDFK